VRSEVLAFCVVGFTLATGLNAISDDAGLSSEERQAIVQEILRDVPLIDGHNDAPWAIRSRFSNHLGDFDFNDTSGITRPMHTDLKRMRRGGIGAQFWSVWVPTDLDGAGAVVTVLQQIDLVHRLEAAYPDDLEMALSADDVVRIHAQGKIASLIGMEGGHSIDSSLAVLRQFYALGARYLTLTHWDNVPWADAATDDPVLAGLSPFGELVVKEMNRLGMLVDISHVSARVMHDVLDVSRSPIIFSHSCAMALNPHPRNVPDDVLLRLPDNGGVVMLNFGSYFISHGAVERSANAEAEEARLKALYLGDSTDVAKRMERWNEDNPVPTLMLSVVVDHLEHIRQVAGIDHVGLGSDFDGVGSLPEGLEDVSGYPALLEELLRRGWSREDVAKVAGLNVLRVMRENERVASRIQLEESALDVLIEEIDSKSS
jgi:membrane dipeptidase